MINKCNEWYPHKTITSDIHCIEQKFIFDEKWKSLFYETEIDCISIGKVRFHSSCFFLVIEYFSIIVDGNWSSVKITIDVVDC